jgi:ParB-like chromosome segregation protein Spo0J
MEYQDFLSEVKRQIEKINDFDLDEKIKLINEIRKEIHSISPFKDEPVDCVQWVPANLVAANDYNPNKVAPPEMKLLEHSIQEDGYTQPIVAWAINGHYEVVDGFHRNRVGKESTLINWRIHNYLPLSIINDDRTDKADRIASTIRHNRARGKHTVEGMSDIVIELKKRNWSNERIAQNLGMDQDEILRLCQITGLSDLFKDQEFSKAWDLEDSEPEFVPLDDDFEVTEKFRTVNTNDENRIFHTHDKWECLKAGFYATTKDDMTRQQCEDAYREFLSDPTRFSNALESVITEWKFSCEHYLTNSAMNRIAWLGQAAMCYATGVPSTFRGGFQLLTKKQQTKANEIAFMYLNEWLKSNNRAEVTMKEALSDNQMDLY